MDTEKLKKVVVDRFEGEFAVCEADNRDINNIEKVRLPEHVKEGDVLIISDSSIEIDKCETEKRKREIEELTEGLWK